MVAATQNERASGNSDRVVTMAVDDNMAYAACVLISSLQHSSREPFTITLGHLTGTLSAVSQDLLRMVCSSLGIPLKLKELRPDARFITQGHISATTFTKFQLSDLHEEPHLWIDADTVALPGWDALFEVVSTAPPHAGLVVAERGAVGGSKELGDPSSLPFNAGILGWPRGRRRDWSSALDDVEIVSTQEQFLLNSLYSHTALRVSEKFNMLTYRIDSLRPQDLPFIIHYAGAHKPWQLSPRFRRECLRHRCPWSQWFAAEKLLLDTLAVPALRHSLARAAESALHSGVVSAGREHTGLRVIKTLNFLGPLGWLVIWGARLIRRRVPRGTHPLH